MGNPAINHRNWPPLPEAAVGYASEGDTIFIQTGRQVCDGEEIAPGIVVLYDQEDGNNVVGITIMGAEGGAKALRGRNPGQVWAIRGRRRRANK